MRTTLTLASIATACTAKDLIANGIGKASYSYDIQNPVRCGVDLTNRNNGPLVCGLDRLTPNQVNSSYIVAMNDTELRGNLERYCGKRVIIKVDGKASPERFFIGDGCQACATSPILALSYSAVEQLNPNICYEGLTDISWEILDEDVYPFQSAQSNTVGKSEETQKTTPTNSAPSNTAKVSLPMSSLTRASKVDESLSAISTSQGPTYLPTITISKTVQETTTLFTAVPNGIRICVEPGTNAKRLRDLCNSCLLRAPTILGCNCGAKLPLLADLSQFLKNNDGVLQATSQCVRPCIWGVDTNETK